MVKRVQNGKKAISSRINVFSQEVSEAVFLARRLKTASWHVTADLVSREKTVTAPYPWVQILLPRL